MKRIFNMFRKHHPSAAKLASKDWDELPENVLCTMDNKLYGAFVAYLLEKYRIESGSNKGKLLLVSNVCNYLGSLLNLAKVKFEPNGSAETKLFFTCLAPNARTTSWFWLKGLRDRIHRICFQRDMQAGNKTKNMKGGGRGGAGSRVPPPLPGHEQGIVHRGIARVCASQV